MANLKEIRVRISSVTSTRQITSAMKMVSASKLRKAQNAILQMRPYAEKLHEILIQLSSSLDETTDNIYGQQHEPKKVLIVAVASNKGLCGAFNANVVKKAIDLSKTVYKDNNVDFWAIGKRASDLLKYKGYNLIDNSNELFNNLKYENVELFAQQLMELFIEGEYDRIDFVYNKFKNAAVQVLIHEQFLPIVIEEGKVDKEELNKDYIFEPSKEFIVNELIPRSLKTQVFKALLDSYASEHGARMTAMHLATDNAGELLDELKLTYNKARQSSITSEILEIVSGAEALKQ